MPGLAKLEEEVLNFILLCFLQLLPAPAFCDQVRREGGHGPLSERFTGAGERARGPGTQALRKGPSEQVIQACPWGWGWGLRGPGAGVCPCEQHLLLPGREPCRHPGHSGCGDGGKSLPKPWWDARSAA